MTDRTKEFSDTWMSWEEEGRKKQQLFCLPGLGQRVVVWNYSKGTSDLLLFLFYKILWCTKDD